MVCFQGVHAGDWSANTNRPRYPLDWTRATNSEGETEALLASLHSPHLRLCAGWGTPTVGNAPETHRLLDLAQPLGLRMVGVLQFVPDSDDPWGVVASYWEKLASGSYLAVSHFTPDGMPRSMPAR